MRVFRGSSGTLLLIPWVFIYYVGAIRTDLYLSKDKFGEFLRLEISEKGCTNVPLNWDNQAISLDTHGSCVKFYDLPYCRGKYVAIQPYHGTFQDNLETLGFKQVISSASPCGPKVPSGRYYILNGADGSVLTIEKKNGSVIAKTLPFKPYIMKNQQFQVDKIALADYEIIPRVHEDLNPVTYDMSISTKTYPVKRSWKIESVYRGKYIIKNEWNSRCLYKSEKGKVEEHECVAWSPNQEWMFKAIKVQPFFPSKEELTKKPIRPDANLPFQPQQDVFPNFHIPRPFIRPGQPLHNPYKNKKKPQAHADENQPKLPIIKNKPFERPNPIVINPGEPFPAVQPVPIYPQSALRLPPIGIGPNGKPDPNNPSIPHVVHPGRLPFPRDPVVTNPKQSVWPPTLFGQFGQWTTARPIVPTTAPKKKNSDEEDEEEDEKEEDEEKEDDDKEEKEDEDDKEEKEDDDRDADREDTEQPEEEREDDDKDNQDADKDDTEEPEEEREDDDTDSKDAENSENNENEEAEEPEQETSKETDEKEDRRGPQESTEEDDEESAEDDESEERRK